MTSKYYTFLIFSLMALSAHSQTPSFKGFVIDPKITIGYGVASGDVDGDGKVDILLADKSQIVWYQNPGKINGDWKKYIMAQNLTENDNVCIAARDIDGDGKVEVAVGAQWNPGETNDKSKSGAVFYLKPHGDVKEMWKAIPLYHEATIHRMRWVKAVDGTFQLIVLPLHGKGNVGGNGVGVNLIAFAVPENRESEWEYQLVQTGMHMTHNFQPMEVEDRFLGLAVAGKEGVQVLLNGATEWAKSGNWMVSGTGVGEVRTGKLFGNQLFSVAIEPMHGNKLVVYSKDNQTVLTDKMKEGHALLCADFFHLGRDQVVMGWRSPNVLGETGLRIFVGQDSLGKVWKEYTLDESIKMACEDMDAADFDGDGDLDIIASGRSTKNLVLYENKLLN